MNDKNMKEAAPNRMERAVEPDGGQRRQFLAILGAAAALLGSEAAAGLAKSTAKVAAGSGSKFAAIEGKLFTEVWKLHRRAKGKLTPAAAKLTVGDLLALSDGRTTTRTKRIQWKDIGSVVEVLTQNYGMNKHPFNTSGALIAGGKAAAGPCCCCTCCCCCGDCTWSVDCDVDFKAAEPRSSD